MLIREIFAEDINRPINGVIKVDQNATDVVAQEIREYVITKELKRHFFSFFDDYCEALDKPTADIGVWISGFFGSGKSHFLKMLSYLLENRQVGDTTTVELFRGKFAEDSGTFMYIDRATRRKAETILFNIDIEGSIVKDKTAVLRVFAKMFYNHLGFYGENLKVAMLEQYIDQLGKTEEFRRVFEQKKGKPWLEQRKAFAFNGKAIIPTLMEVLDMSEEDAKSWFHDKTAVEFSIARLVEDIRAYVEKKPCDFRLLFMVDEVGQYVGTDTDMLLNLQSLTEKIGSECGGKVWIVCTGQEAIDEIIKVRADEFSRIQARFKTRLSLSSSSVDEVIQKRILKKKPEYQVKLENLYSTGSTDAELRNLFTFDGARLDMKGFSSPKDFADNYPFSPYQFTLIQNVFSEIRKRGNAGKHMSGGERSMLSGFQEAAQKIQDKDEHALVPFFRFYDTVCSFLDSSIRRVIERSQKAAEIGAGIETEDVALLKLLYLIRYVDDVPANVDNLVILMADDIRTDKIALREKVHASLNRLLSQNYIGRTGEIYNFLTDEEQDIQRDIRNTNVDTASIVEQIAKMIFADIYTSKKYQYGKYPFDFDKMVDSVTIGAVTGGMRLRFLSVATDAIDKSELRLMTESKGQAVVALADTPYYDSLESAMKIRKYVKQKNVVQLPNSVQTIIRDQLAEAGKLETASLEELKKAIQDAQFYVDGERIEIKGGDAKARIDQALNYLVTHVYSELGRISKNIETDAEITEILSGANAPMPGFEPNRDAAAAVEEYLIMQDRKKLPTSMADVQSRYQSAPYGWREIDIAAVVALLIFQQRVTIKYGGATVQPDNPRLPDMLRKRNEIGRTVVSIRQVVNAAKMKKARELLREYFDVMDVPSDEDGLVAFISEKFETQKSHYDALDERYNDGRHYPDREKVQQAIKLTEDVLSQRKDNIALIDRLIRLEDDLLDSKEDLQNVESFFKNQVQLFDAAAQLEEDLRNELDYLSHEPESNEALNKIRLITFVPGGFSYKKVPELSGLIAIVRQGHDRLLDEKRGEVQDIAAQCMSMIHQASGESIHTKDVVARADEYYRQKREAIRAHKSLALLDGLVPPMLQYKDQCCARIEALLEPPKPQPEPEKKPEAPKPVKKIIKTYNRQILFPSSTLSSDEEIDAYVEKIRDNMKQLLKNCDGIQLK